MSERKCAACGSSELDPGCLVDTVPGGFFVQRWLRGYPEYSFWRGLKVRDRELYYVQAEGCRACGYLNLYLGPQVSPQASGPRT